MSVLWVIFGFTNVRLIAYNQIILLMIELPTQSSTIRFLSFFMICSFILTINSVPTNKAGRSGQ